MDFAPILKFVSVKVDDLQYAEKYFADLFDLEKNLSLDIIEKENFDKNKIHNTAELFSNEGGASLQFIEIDSNKFHNSTPNLLQLGIIGIKIQSRNLNRSFFHYRDMNIQSFSDIRVNPLYHKHFHIIAQDFLFQIKEDKKNSFGFLNKKNGGVSGIIIGVKDFEMSKLFYKNVLGYDTVIYEGEGKFEDFDGINGGDVKFKRIILQQSKIYNTKYSNFFGKNEIELIKVIDRNNINIKSTNVVNPFRFGYFSADNRNIIGNYLELGNEFNLKGNQDFIQIKDPNGIEISCNESTYHKKPNIFDDLSIFTKFFKHKL